MSARLTGRGRALLGGALALLFVAATSGQAFAAAAAALMLGALAGARLDAMLQGEAARALGIELDLADGPAPVRGDPLTVILKLTHAGAHRLRDVELTFHASGEPGPTEPVALEVPPGATGTLAVTLRFPQAGAWRTLGVALEVSGWLGLATAHRYVPLEAAISARPRPVPAGDLSRVLTPVGAFRDREGRHVGRMIGSGLELRELRDYVPGDPLKTVAWKATARRQRPLVRAFEEETVRRIQILVDMGPTMRAGEPGQAPLDAAVDLAAALVEHCAGDRVGLTTFDQRVYGHLRPEPGRAHRQRLLHHLLDLTRVVDEDLTEISDAELVARVGAFLERQQHLLVRRLGDDPGRASVARALVDPLRELFDEAAVFSAVTTWLAEDRDRGNAMLFAKSRPAKDLLTARLRLFCALRGLSLPYRLTGAPDARETGLTAAVSRNLGAGGADTLLILSDLRGVRADGPAMRALALARAHKRQVVLGDLGATAAPATLREALRSARVVYVRPGEGPKRAGPAPFLQPTEDAPLIQRGV